MEVNRCSDCCSFICFITKLMHNFGECLQPTLDAMKMQRTDSYPQDLLVLQT